MSSWPGYSGDRYLDLEQIEALLRSWVAAAPAWCQLETMGRSREGRPLWLLTIGRVGGAAPQRPAIWLDGGTHASEWTGVMAALVTASRWLEGLVNGHAELVEAFGRTTAFVAPCISPDGFAAMVRGAPYLRSSTRPPPEGTIRVGFEARDIDGDGVVRTMRWRHPSGPYVQDETVPGFLRPRTLDDDPAQAWFLSTEGAFLRWDGVRWADAPLEFGLDLNRNFVAHWEPFEMFGMDGGDIPLGEPESRAVVDAFRARKGIAVGLTNHTYTGALLTQPYRDPSPLGVPDIELMEALGREAVQGTGYRVIRVHPDFVYDPKRAVVGVWSDTMATVFGVPGYTLELWDPAGAAGLKVDKPAEFFRHPDIDLIRKLVLHFQQTGQGEPPPFEAWRPHEHPQLGPVEIGGLDYLRTIRNPPVAVLASECDKGFRVADRLRRALPRLEGSLRLEALAEGLLRVDLVLENRGYLPTCGLRHASKAVLPPIATELVLGPGQELVEGDAHQAIEHLDGWGSLVTGAARHPIYAGLGEPGVRARARWTVRGAGAVEVRWSASRAGSGVLRVATGAGASDGVGRG